MTPDTALLTLALTACAALPVCAAIAYRLGKRHANAVAHRLMQRNLDALRACQAQMIRGSALMEVRVRDPHPNADKVLTIAVIDGKGYAFTDSVLPRAASIYANAVAKGQIDPVTK